MKLSKTQKSKVSNIYLNEDDYANFFNLASGIYKPYKTFFKKKDYLNFISTNKKNFTFLPVLLFINKNFRFIKGEKSKLIFRQKIIGHIRHDEFFRVDKIKLIKKIYGFLSIKHPIIKKFISRESVCLSGKLMTKSIYVKNFIKNFKKKYKNNLINSVAFSSRNIPHLGHEFIINNLIKKGFKNVFVIYINSRFNFCDYNLFNNCYKYVSKKLKKKLFVINLYLPSFKAGPKEALFQAKLIKNLGIKYFSVGRDHAGISNFYQKYAAQNYLKRRNIQIKYVFNKEPVIDRKTKEIFFYDSKSRNLRNKNIKKGIDFFSGGKNIEFIRNKNFKKLLFYIDKDIVKFLKKNKF